MIRCAFETREAQGGEDCKAGEGPPGLLIWHGLPDEVDGVDAGRKGQGEQAIVALGCVWGDFGAVEAEVPGGVLTAVKDEELGLGQGKLQVCGRLSGRGVRGSGLIFLAGLGGVGEKPERWIMGLEGFRIGIGGGVFVGGLGAERGVEEGDAGGYGVFVVAKLVEGDPGGGDEEADEEKGEGEGARGCPAGVAVEDESGEEGEDESEESAEAPGELQEAKLGEVGPDEGRGGGEEESDGEGEGGEEQEGVGLRVVGVAAAGEGQSAGNAEEEGKGDFGGGADDVVMEEVVGGVAGHAVEEEVVGGLHAGADGHVDRDEAALVGGGKDVEGGEAEAEEGAGGDRESEAPGLRAGSQQQARGSKEGEGVGGEHGGGSVGEPQEGEGQGDGEYARVALEGGGDEEGEKGGCEQLGESGALVGGEEHVGVSDIEGGAKKRGRGSGVAAGEREEGEAGSGEGDPGEGGGDELPGEHEAEQAAEDPGNGGIEEEAGLAGVVGGGEGPVREAAVAKLDGSFEPAQEVEVEIVAAGGSTEKDGEDGKQSHEGDQGAAGARRHASVVS